MANRSGPLALVRGVRAYFTAQSIPARVVAGWKARDRKDNAAPDGASRVVFMPGAFDVSGGGPRPLPAGRLTREAPQNYGVPVPTTTPFGDLGAAPPRALAWWEYILTACVWAVDPERPQDEESQIDAVELLLEQTVQGIHNAVDPDTGVPVGFGNIREWGDAFWTLPPKEQSYGRELCFSFVLLVPLFDQVPGVAFPSPAVQRVHADYPLYPGE